MPHNLPPSASRRNEKALKITIGEQVVPAVTDLAETATEQINLMSSSVEQAELVDKLQELGFSFSEINDIIGDGKA